MFSILSDVKLGVGVICSPVVFFLDHPSIMMHEDKIKHTCEIILLR